MGATVLGYHRFRRSDAVDFIFSLLSLLFLLGMLVLFAPALGSLLYHAVAIYL